MAPLADYSDLHRQAGLRGRARSRGSRVFKMGRPSRVHINIGLRGDEIAEARVGEQSAGEETRRVS